MTHARRAAAGLAALAVAVALLVAGGVAWRHYTQRYTVTTDDSGEAVARVVAVAFHGHSALKVASISGTIQATAADVRGFGWLRSDQVMKAPFTVEYFVDVSRLARRDVRWDAASRTLTVDVPAVSIGEPNVDEARATLVSTHGIFVTRGAGEALARKIAGKADALARAEAGRPGWIAAARANARRDLTALLAIPLAAAGTPPATIRVRFPDEVGTTPAASERMDRSRSLDQVFGLDR